MVAVSKKYLHTFISAANREKGPTVLLTTHDIGNMEKPCSRVVIDSSCSMYDGDLESMVQRSGSVRSLMIEFEEPGEDFPVEGAWLTKSEGCGMGLVKGREKICGAGKLTFPPFACIRDKGAKATDFFIQS